MSTTTRTWQELETLAVAAYRSSIAWDAFWPRIAPMPERCSNAAPRATERFTGDC